MWPVAKSRGWRRVGRIVYFVVMTLLTVAVVLFFAYGVVAFLSVGP